MSSKIELFEAAQKVYVKDMFSNLGSGMRHNEVNNIGTFSMPDNQYHALSEVYGKPMISQSGLKKFDESAETWKANIPFNTSRAMVLGSLVDAAVLNPEGLGDYLFPEGKEADGRTKEGKAMKIQAYKTGKDVVSPAEVTAILGNIKKLSEDETCKEILAGSSTQIQMMDTRNDLGIRGMIDIIPSSTGRFGDGICDMKRTGQFLPAQWRKHVLNMKYHWQAAFYLDMWNDICDLHGNEGEKRSKWYFLLCSSDAPYGCGVSQLSDEYIKRGREGYMNALMKFNQCVMTGEYKNPWATDGIQMVKAYGEE
tara:strand:+ start:1129 stop:2058 length:930 start_codon:yes stop_codon:yes gene_type:complete